MDAILLAAGMGKRMNIDCPKQFYKINGKPILIYSLEVLNRSPHIDRILLVCNMDYLEQYKKYVSDYGIEKVTDFVPGGLTRQQSVISGLWIAESDRVLIHEAARPLISEDFIEYLIGFNDEAVVPVVPVNFTVAIGKKYMKQELNRNKVVNIQLPQVFDTYILQKSHVKATQRGNTSTEDSSLVFHYGYKVRFVEGRESNIKITTNLDLEIVNSLLKFNE